MKKLLSLPTNVVGKFHEITSLSRDEFFCTSDPEGKKLGSGGGTAWLLLQERLARTVATDTDENKTDPALSESENRENGLEKRILIHGGGQSRRLPAYASSGKLLTPVPVFRWARGQRIDQTLLDLQLPLYEHMMERSPRGLNTLIASGDVYLRATEPLQPIPEGVDVVCYGLWATPEQIAHHGVFMMRRDEPEVLDFMLQKPSAEEQAAYMQTHFALIDVGVWILSDRAVDVLLRKSTLNRLSDILSEKTLHPDAFCYYDLYSDFGCALGRHPSKPDAEIACWLAAKGNQENVSAEEQGLKVAILPLNGGEFYHFGTGEEMLGSSMELQNLVKDQRFIIQRGVKKQSSVFTQNSRIPTHFSQEQTYIWVENSALNEHWHLEGHNIVTGVPENDWKVCLSDGICLDIEPIGESAYVLRPYGYRDAFRGRLGAPDTTFLGQPLSAVRSDGQPRWDLSQLGGKDCDIQAAPLFPVTDSVEEMGVLLRWMLTGEGDASRYYRTRRLSADDISREANLPRLFAQRRRLQVENLSVLARNWRKSVFYQLDLDDIAKKFDENKIDLPAPLPDDAPLLTRIHDAMFRGDADSAFSLLQEGIKREAILNKMMPHRTTFDDQIVWARSAARIDLAGGWTDTPPYCLLAGGNVVNVAIELNGQQPLQVYVKPCREPVIICRSIDLGAVEKIETFEELAQYNKVGSPFSIPKAALTLCGFLPDYCQETFRSLRDQLEAFGCGIEISLLAAIPAGSGLGTSSILAATVLGALADFCGLGWDRNEVCNRTLILEQLLTTGGGWQDQYGGVLSGIKLLQTSAGFDQNATARYLPDTVFKSPDFRDCHLLYYTGLTRTAKDILAEIVRGMFLNSNRHLRLLDEMRSHALSLFEAIQLADFERYGSLVRTTWEQNKLLDAGTNPPLVEELCRRIDDLCLGYKLPGAGGGGFMYMVAKDAQAAQRIRRMLNDRPLTDKSRFVELSLSKKGLQISRS